MNFDEKRLTGAVFLDVAKAFDTVLVDGLPTNPQSLIFPRTLSKPYPEGTDVRSVLPDSHIH
jgi:hypothetical protein